LTPTVDFRKKLAQRIEGNGNKSLSDEDLIGFSKEFIEVLGESNSMSSMKLYRYMPFNYNNIRSIEKGAIYLSEIGKMNDVFEGLTLVHDSQTIDFKDLHDLVYLKSFSEEKDNLLMWSHYGDNHKGLCIEYELKHILNQQDNEKNNLGILYHLFPVIYLENRVDDESAFNNLKYASKSINQYKSDLKDKNVPEDVEWHKDIKSLFLIKSKKWEYEKEWRIAVTFMQMNEKDEEPYDGNKVLYNINNQNIPFDCITSIYFGANLENDKQEHIEEIVSRLNNDKDKKISVYKNILNPGEYKLDTELIV